MPQTFVRFLGVLVVVLAALSMPASAGMVEAEQAYSQGDYQTAFTEYLAEAEAGNADAQYELAFLYFDGLGTKQSYDDAAKWFLAAAEQGHADAQFQYSEMLYWGDGMAVDLKQSAYWTRQAAEQGHAEAQFALGSMYYAGEGVPYDLTESARWTLMAAEQGHMDAQYEMGWVYYLGEGAEVNMAESIRWLKAAAEQGHYDAPYDLGDTYYYGDGIEPDYAEAVRWYRMAADMGHYDAQIRLKELGEALVAVDGPVEGQVVGLWELYIFEANDWKRWTLDIAADGTYVFYQEDVFGHSGTFSAKDGSWQMTSETSAWTDSGTYEVPTKNTFNMVGTLGPGSWHRVEWY